jgi:hypothetical protein
MTDLCPSAQAVLNAAMTTPIVLGDYAATRGRQIAAAIRAAADQVVPEPPMIVEGGRTYEEAWTATVHGDIRRKLLAIVTELEAHQ